MIDNTDVEVMRMSTSITKKETRKKERQKDL